FRVAQVAHARVGTHARLGENPLRVALADTVDVRQGVFDFLFPGKIHTGDTRHTSSLAAVCAWDCACRSPATHRAAAHFAMLADRSHARTHLHRDSCRK